jgi:exodeoxyribonuclease V alpha subunit
VREIQVLCPMNRSLTGARGINQMLQEALNPPGENSIEKSGYRFSVADKVCRSRTTTTRTSITATSDL